jgi:hypothetical protein
MENECMLTTIDNPFDYFEQFDSWNQFDIEKGYYTCAYLAKIVNTKTNLYDNDLTQQELNELIEQSIDEIIELNPLHIYKKVHRN